MKIDGIEFSVEVRHGFKEEGTFASYYAAEKWLASAGYSRGSMQLNAPIGLMHGDYNISKWRGLSKSDIKQLDGVMISDDFREGSVEIVIFKRIKSNA